MPVFDAHQRVVADRLQRLVLSTSKTDAAERQNAPGRGLYVHGPVGRGKTWLCDEFFDALPTTAKRRVHFHGFFRELHQAIWRHRVVSGAGSASGLDAGATSDAGAGVGVGVGAYAGVGVAIGSVPAPASARQDAVGDAIADLLAGVDLLYFDGFHVHDSGDAVLISRVLEAVFARGITLLATSNYHPADLLPSPGFHDLIEPAIALLEAHVDIVELGGTVDFRRVRTAALTSANGAAGAAEATGGGFTAGTWVSPAGLAMAGLTPPHPSEETTLSAGGHSFTARRARGTEVWFRFDDLCEANASVADYLEWASVFDTWVIERVPVLGSATPQAGQRFANLVDVLCDRDATLHVLSEHTADAALRAETLPRDFARAASRLTLLRSVR